MEKHNTVKDESIQIDILGIRSLRWTGTGHFQSEVHIVYYSEHEKERRNGVAFIVRKDKARMIFACNAISDHIVLIRFFFLDNLLI